MADRWIADSLPSERYPIYTRANAGEVMPDPVSPLTASWGLVGPGEAGWRDAYVRAGTFDRDEFEPDRANCLGVFGGYLFLNMSTTRIYGVRFPGLTPELVDQQYFGDMPGITPYADEARPTDEHPVATERLQAFLQWVFAQADLPWLRDDRAEVERLVAHRPSFDELTDQQLIDHARSTLPLYRRLFTQHIVTSASAGVGLSVVGQVAAAVGRPDLALTLVAGLGDVDSAAPSWAMWDMGRIVAASPSLTQAFDAGTDGLSGRIDELAAGGDEAAAAFAARFREFLRRFGSRGPNEWDLRSAVWAVEPRTPLAAIDRMRLAPDADSPQARTEARVVEREAALATVRAALAGAPADDRAQFEAGLQAAHVFNPGRERTKTTCILLVHEQRLVALELGRRWAAKGLLQQPEHVFMLADHELDDVAGRAAGHPPMIPLPDHAGLAAEREAHFLTLWQLEPPFVSHGAPPPVASWPRKGRHVEVAAAAGDTLTGIPGCPGVAVGRARVVLDATDPAGLEPGEVLVAPFTDPAWTPLFVPAAAVVVNVGAQITHAVIVSRELGLPCVVSVTGATDRIPDGALVEVDGAAGTVRVLELPARP